jgi:nitroreductase
MSAPFDLSVTDELLSTTRAVRRRLDLERPVERDVILDCIRLSQQAPTGGNAQGWSWVVVTDPGKRKALAELYTRLGMSTYLRPTPRPSRAEKSRPLVSTAQRCS